MVVGSPIDGGVTMDWMESAAANAREGRAQDRLDRERDLERRADMAGRDWGAESQGQDPLAAHRFAINQALKGALEALRAGDVMVAERTLEVAIGLVDECELAQVGIRMPAVRAIDFEPGLRRVSDDDPF